jgi:hypothetical protein
MVFPYLVGRALYRVKLFLADWFLGGFRIVSRMTVNMLESLDRRWAVLITFRNIFQPLYQDHTFTGRILGFIFRTIRIAIGLALYVIVFVGGVIAYILWATIPLYILYWGFGK